MHLKLRELDNVIFAREVAWMDCEVHITQVKKRHIFLANLTKIFKHSLSVREIFFGSEI